MKLIFSEGDLAVYTRSVDPSSDDSSVLADYVAFRNGDILAAGKNLGDLADNLERDGMLIFAEIVRNKISLF